MKENYGGKNDIRKWEFEISDCLHETKLWEIEYSASFLTASRLQNQFDRLGVLPGAYSVHNLPLEDGYIRMAMLPAPESKDLDYCGPMDLYRLLINRAHTNHDGIGGVKFELYDYIISPSNVSVTLESSTLEYEFGVKSYELTDGSPPLIWPDSLGSFKLFPSNNYHPPRMPDLNYPGRDLRELVDFREKIEPLIECLKNFSKSVTEEVITQKYNNESDE